MLTGVEAINFYAFSYGADHALLLIPFAIATMLIAVFETNSYH